MNIHGTDVTPDYKSAESQGISRRDFEGFCFLRNNGFLQTIREQLPEGTSLEEAMVGLLYQYESWEELKADLPTWDCYAGAGVKFVEYGLRDLFAYITTPQGINAVQLTQV